MCQHLRPILHEDQFDTGVKAHPTADDQAFTVSCGIAVVRHRWVASCTPHISHRSTPHSKLEDSDIQESPHDNHIELPERIHTQFKVVVDQSFVLSLAKRGNYRSLPSAKPIEAALHRAIIHGQPV
jgi:hypothetical protein